MLINAHISKSATTYCPWAIFYQSSWPLQLSPFPVAYQLVLHLSANERTLGHAAENDRGLYF